MSDRLRESSRGRESKADVEEERVGNGGVGLLIRRGAVVRGGWGMGVRGDGGTLNLGLAGDSTVK